MPKTDTTSERLREKLNGLDLGTHDNRALFEEVQRRGFLVTKDERAERQVKLDVPKQGRVRFGIVSDTHLGHMKQQLTHWRAFAEHASKWGAEFMLHCGDLVDGQNMHRDQAYELFKHGVQAQGEYAASVVPKLVGRSSKKVLPTHVIGGNHDGAGWNDAGANVLDVLRARRPDINLLGAPSATFHMGTVRILMLHPDGGVPYARSYRLQKIVEQFAPDDKPHILLTGHWHVDCLLPGYRNVWAFSLGCFQAQTAYMKRKAIAPVISGLLLDVTYSSRGIECVSFEWPHYPTPLRNDWP